MLQFSTLVSFRCDKIEAFKHTMQLESINQRGGVYMLWQPWGERADDDTLLELMGSHVFQRNACGQVGGSISICNVIKVAIPLTDPATN